MTKEKDATQTEATYVRPKDGEAPKKGVAPKGDEVYEEDEDKSKPDWQNRLFRVVVHRLNTEKENASLPISVHCVGLKKRVLNPGEETTLYGYHISILRDAVEEDEIEIPSESAVYQAEDPLRKAEENFPGFRATVREEDGTIIVHRRLPMYSVEIKSEIQGRR